MRFVPAVVSMTGANMAGMPVAPWTYHRWSKSDSVVSIIPPRRASDSTLASLMTSIVVVRSISS
jgi:hypothetical protein